MVISRRPTDLSTSLPATTALRFFKAIKARHSKFNTFTLEGTISLRSSSEFQPQSSCIVFSEVAEAKRRARIVGRSPDDPLEMLQVFLWTSAGRRDIIVRSAAAIHRLSHFTPTLSRSRTVSRSYLPLLQLPTVFLRWERTSLTRCLNCSIALLRAFKQLHYSYTREMDS